MKHSIQRFIFSSTAAVYGFPDGGVASEESALAPINPYGTSKLMSERMLRDTSSAHGMQYVALRYFNVAGADPQARMGQRTHEATHLIKVACQAMQSSKTDSVFTMEDGVTPLNYTTVREDIWSKSLIAAGLPHRAMYGLRHTFIGWMVLLGIDSTRLKMLAGHASRSTLTEDTYGEFREGLLAERERILEYLGRDCLEPEEFKRGFHISTW